MPVRQDTDVLVACQKGRALAARQGLLNDEQVIVVIAISEVANNIIRYAQCGEIVLSAVQCNGQSGIQVVARDDGPGIPDIAQALQDGYSSGGGLGLGLSGAKRLMDEFDIISEVGRGTVVTMAKWRSQV